MKQHKFTWIDGLVLAVIVLLAAGTVVKFLILDPTSRQRETVPFSYELKVAGIRQYTLDALQTGDVLYDDEGKGAVGVISEIRAEPSMLQASYPDGTVRRVPQEDRYDVYLTIDAEGVRDGDVYKVGTYTIYVNQNTLYFTKYSTWFGQVTRIFGAAS